MQPNTVLLILEILIAAYCSGAISLQQHFKPDKNSDNPPSVSLPSSIFQDDDIVITENVRNREIIETYLARILSLIHSHKADSLRNTETSVTSDDIDYDETTENNEEPFNYEETKKKKRSIRVKNTENHDKNEKTLSWFENSGHNKNYQAKHTVNHDKDEYSLFLIENNGNVGISQARNIENLEPNEKVLENIAYEDIINWIPQNGQNANHGRKKESVSFINNDGDNKRTYHVLNTGNRSERHETLGFSNAGILITDKDRNKIVPTFKPTENLSYDSYPVVLLPVIEIRETSEGVKNISTVGNIKNNQRATSSPNVNKSGLLISRRNFENEKSENFKGHKNFPVPFSLDMFLFNADNVEGKKVTSAEDVEWKKTMSGKKVENVDETLMEWIENDKRNLASEESDGKLSRHIRERSHPSSKGDIPNVKPNTTIETTNYNKDGQNSKDISQSAGSFPVGNESPTEGNSGKENVSLPDGYAHNINNTVPSLSLGNIPPSKDIPETGNNQPDEHSSAFNKSASFLPQNKTESNKEMTKIENNKSGQPQTHSSTVKHSTTPLHEIPPDNEVSARENIKHSQPEGQSDNVNHSSESFPKEKTTSSKGIAETENNRVSQPERHPRNDNNSTTSVREESIPHTIGISDTENVKRSKLERHLGNVNHSSTFDEKTLYNKNSSIMKESSDSEAEGHLDNVKTSTVSFPDRKTPRIAEFENAKSNRHDAQSNIVKNSTVSFNDQNNSPSKEAPGAVDDKRSQPGYGNNYSAPFSEEKPPGNYNIPSADIVKGSMPEAQSNGNISTIPLHDVDINHNKGTSGLENTNGSPADGHPSNVHHTADSFPGTNVSYSENTNETKNINSKVHSSDNNHPATAFPNVKIPQKKNTSETENVKEIQQDNSSNVNDFNTRLQAEKGINWTENVSSESHSDNVTLPISSFHDSKTPSNIISNMEITQNGQSDRHSSNINQSSASLPDFRKEHLIKNNSEAENTRSEENSTNSNHSVQNSDNASQKKEISATQSIKRPNGHSGDANQSASSLPGGKTPPNQNISGTENTGEESDGHSSSVNKLSPSLPDTNASPRAENVKRNQPGEYANDVNYSTKRGESGSDNTDISITKTFEGTQPKQYNSNETISAVSVHDGNISPNSQDSGPKIMERSQPEGESSNVSHNETSFYEGNESH